MRFVAGRGPLRRSVCRDAALWRMVWGTMAEMLLAGPPWRRCWRNRCGLAGPPLQNICREAAPGRNAIRKTPLAGAPGRRGRSPMPPAARKENGLPLVGADDFGNVDEVVCNTLGIAGHL